MAGPSFDSIVCWVVHNNSIDESKSEIQIWDRRLVVRHEGQVCPIHHEWLLEKRPMPFHDVVEWINLMRERKCVLLVAHHLSISIQWQCVDRHYLQNVFHLLRLNWMHQNAIRGRRATGIVRKDIQAQTEEWTTENFNKLDVPDSIVGMQDTVQPVVVRNAQ